MADPFKWPLINVVARYYHEAGENGGTGRAVNSKVKVTCCPQCPGVENVVGYIIRQMIIWSQTQMGNKNMPFLATLVALHLTPMSK